MNEPLKSSALLGEALLDAVRQAVREEILTLKGEINGHEDRLLDAEGAARLLSVSSDWLYRNSKRLPFTRKLGSKMLRFSYNGIQKWLTTRKL